MTMDVTSEPLDVTIPAGRVRLPGLLGLPENAAGLVIFAHGSGSSRMSRRNRAVASDLRDAGLATLLFDLLTEQEADDRALVFDIPFLAGRVRAATAWSRTDYRTSSLPIGLFGASTGAAAAIVGATEGTPVDAIVSRGGRPDLAGDAIERVEAPTLLIVGGEDDACIPLNQQALERLRCEKRMVTIPGAGHLFEESDSLDRVAQFARDWFTRHMGRKQEE